MAIDMTTGLRNGCIYGILWVYNIMDIYIIYLYIYMYIYIYGYINIFIGIFIVDLPLKFLVLLTAPGHS